MGYSRLNRDMLSALDWPAGGDKGGEVSKFKQICPTVSVYLVN